MRRIAAPVVGNDREGLRSDGQDCGERSVAGLRALTPSPSPDPAGEGGRSFGFSLIVVLVVTVFAFSVTSARADGEAGLVIQNGDATTTYCVPFKGDSITGADLLSAAGLGYEQFGGAARTVCSIGGTGCSNAASFEGCFCQCQGANCTYWAFFTQKHGEGWVYASLAFNLLRAKDGDVQGWKWGRGSPNNAPAPNAVTFENICGHGPRGGEDLLPTPTLVPTQQPATATASPPSASATDAAPGKTTTTVASKTEAPGPSPAAAASSPVASVSATAAIPAATDAIGTVTVTTALTRSPTALAPATGGPGAANGAGGSSGLLAFAAVAGGLVVVTAAAVVWRRRHGA